jgi:hypothetical protein
MGKRSVNQSDLECIARATATLRLIDIVLFDSNFTRSSGAVSLASATKQKYKKVVSYQFGEAEDDDELFVVKIDLGVRLFPASNETSDDGVAIIEIEAGFVALYRVTNKVENECYELFAEQNAVHIVWPFWRQHVFDITQRAHLPRIEIPLRAGNLQGPADRRGEPLPTKS